MFGYQESNMEQEMICVNVQRAREAGGGGGVQPIAHDPRDEDRFTGGRTCALPLGGDGWGRGCCLASSKRTKSLVGACRAGWPGEKTGGDKSVRNGFSQCRSISRAGK